MIIQLKILIAYSYFNYYFASLKHFKQFNNLIMNYLKAIGEVIKTYRELNDLSQKEASLLIGCSQQQFSKYENGKCGGMSVDMLVNIAKALSIPIKLFFNWDREKDAIMEMKELYLKNKELLEILKENPRLSQILRKLAKNK